jgi:integrase
MKWPERRYRPGRGHSDTQIQESVTMSKQHSTTRPERDKPSKPYPEFPLFPHATKRWAKKIRGKMHYFGPWDDPDGALKKYEEQKDALHAGRTPRPDQAALTVKDLANAFLNHKQAKLDSGELSRRTWDGYKEIAVLMVSHFGKTRRVDDLGPAEFAALRNKVAKRWGPHGLSRLVQGVRSVFKYADDAGLIDRPMRFGPGFTRPTKKTLRLHRARQGTKLFTAEEVRRLLSLPPWRPAAGVQLGAMILLGINCGFGNADCGTLPLSAVDLESGMIDFPRPKTGIPRRCPLWPETVEAVRAALAVRPEPKNPEHAGLVFITQRGLPWARDNDPAIVTKEMSKLLRSLGLNGHQTFYTLRHTFRTVADEAKDQPAADYIMGHEVPHMSSIYRETISDERLKAVTDHVRAWLFAGKGSKRQDVPGADRVQQAG